jgi:hypothetical protein
MKERKKEKQLWLFFLSQRKLWLSFPSSFTPVTAEIWLMGPVVFEATWVKTTVSLWPVKPWPFEVEMTSFLPLVSLC